MGGRIAIPGFKTAGRAVRQSDPATISKWYRDGLHFSCTQCGRCCGGDPGYVWVTKAEIRRISVLLGRTDGWLDEKHVRHVRLGYSLTERQNGDCVFLDYEGDGVRCCIYSVRLLQCRTWPFWAENLRSLDDWNRAHTKCPGINTGEHFDFARIEAIRTQKEW